MEDKIYVHIEWMVKILLYQNSKIFNTTNVLLRMCLLTVVAGGWQVQSLTAWVAY